MTEEAASADPPDAAQRERALDPTRSFIVQAPAGSGKTELLIRRYLALLPTVESPEEIVALTFTRKAAAEMRARVLLALQAEGDPLALNPARLRIQTIDSLALSLTRQMPVLSRFGAQPQSVEDAGELHAAAARATLARVEGGGAVADHVECLLEHLDNDVGRVEALLADMLARRDHWIRHLLRMQRVELEASLGAERDRAVGQARALFPGPQADGVEDWQALAETLLTKDGGWRKRSPQGKAFFAQGEASEPLREALLALRALPPAVYSDAQWHLLQALAGLLPVAIAELLLVFQSRGQVDFTEVAQGALRALGEEGAPTDLALALDYRIRHLLIDEFQDTSISQFELIAALTAGWEPGDGRTLFAVGDPMQSIYRFREAEVGLFLRSRRAGIGTVELEPLALSANFRSQSGVVAWVNAAFARLMPKHEDPASGAVPYTPSDAVHAALPGDAVTVHAFYNRDREGEAARVVELAAAARHDDPGSSVAILVRTRSHLLNIVPQLKAAGLRFRAVEIDELVHRPVVQDLLALTRALCHAADRLAWLAVLRAPWCGLTLADLSCLAEASDATLLEAISDADRLGRLSADGRARVERVSAVLRQAVSNRLRGSLRNRVEQAWLAIGGPACAGDATDLEDAGLYLDHLESREAAGALADSAGFETGLAKLYALADLQAGEELQVMTIHKAKGLQFDHVILPGLGRTTRGDDRRLFLWSETLDGLLLAPIQEAGADGDAIYAWLQRLDAVKEGFESARLLYVAATRARKRVHLLGDTLLRDGDVRPPRAKSSLARLWPVLGAQFEADAAKTPPATPTSTPRGPPDQSLIRLAVDWSAPPAPPALDWAAPAQSLDARDAPEFSWVGETARHIGSVVHRWLQRIAEDGLNGWDRQRVERMSAQFARELTARGVVAAELEAAVAQVGAGLRNAIEDERGRWLLGPRPQAASELRLRTAADGVLRTLVVDRTFVEDGRRWIVDYKTSRHEGAAPDAFLERERERYAPQLERYARALGTGGQPTSLGLYYPLLRGWQDWSC